jgi:hypothetical protein
LAPAVALEFLLLDRLDRHVGLPDHLGRFCRVSHFFEVAYGLVFDDSRFCDSGITDLRFSLPTLSTQIRFGLGLGYFLSKSL